MAGSSVTVTHQEPAPAVGVIVATCVADDTDGSFPDTVLPAIDGQILSIITDPGTPAPTTLYDVTAVDADGFDRLGGAGANRAAATTERAAVTGAFVGRREALTLTLANNSVNSAQLVVTIHYTGRV